MNNLNWFFTLLCLLHPAHAEAGDFSLSPGMTQVLKLGSAPGAIRVKGRNVIHVEDGGSQIKVTAQQIGSATVAVGTQIYRFFVVPKSQIEFLKSLQDLVKDFIGLQIEWRDGEIVIAGHLYRLTDWQAIAELAEEHGANFSLRAHLDPDVQSQAGPWLRERAKESHLTLPQVIYEPSAKALISSDQKDLALIWDKIFAPLGIERVYEKSQIAIEPLVRVRIVVAEVNKRVQSQLGIEWPEMIAASVLPKLSGPSQLEVFLKAMERNGLGQILASPNLLARSGSEADFLAGGEFGIKVSTARSKEVIWKHHGIYLKIKPRADRSGRMSIELTTEVSLIDGAQSVDGIPGLKTNRMSTQFDLSSSRTIILSGLIRNDWGEERSGIAGLSQLPILGALFRSENFYQNKSELVIFVTPEIVDDAAPQPMNKDLMPKNWSAK